MTIDKISKYRSEIMGMAILLIIVCHSTLAFSGGILKAYDYMRSFCKIGVDIFFMMSGLGLYNSFNRDNNILRFYKKRLTRLLPAYIFVVVIWAVISVGLSIESLTDFFWKYSLVSFWLDGELAEWFIAAIVLLYLIFPVLYWLLKTHSLVLYGLWAIVYGVTFYISMTQVDQSAIRLINEAFVVRIPAFLTGILIGEQISVYVTRKINTATVIWYGIGSIVLLCVNVFANSVCERWVERVLFLPCAFCIIMLVSILLNGAEKRMGKYVLSLLGFFGGITLEIYMIHEKVLMIYDRFTINGTVGSLLSNITAVTMTIILSVWMAQIIKRFEKALENKR
ncbi:MAG: acyltransferase [Clostridia bacterium]|nr:acyltransferase [Clostridia bacterium]